MPKVTNSLGSSIDHIIKFLEPLSDTDRMTAIKSACMALHIVLQKKNNTANIVSTDYTDTKDMFKDKERV